MRGIVFTGEVEVRDDVEVREPGPLEVKVRIYRAGLCHSDVSVIDGTIPFPPPVVLGHEGAGLLEVFLGELVDAKGLGQRGGQGQRAHPRPAAGLGGGGFRRADGLQIRGVVQAGGNPVQRWRERRELCIGRGIEPGHNCVRCRSTQLAHHGKSLFLFQSSCCRSHHADQFIWLPGLSASRGLLLGTYRWFDFAGLCRPRGFKRAFYLLR